MSKSGGHILVIGGGLAAHATVRRLHASGVQVTLLSRGAGGTNALWGGLGYAFGPFTDPPPDSAGAVEGRQTRSAPFRAARDERWSRLMERRGEFHPYRRLGLEFDDVRESLARGLRLLETELLVGCEDGTRVAGPYGGPAAPDVLARSVAPMDFRDVSRVGLVDCPALSGWRADTLANQFDRVDTLEAVVLRTPTFGDLDGRHPASLARQLEEAFADGSRDVVGELRDAVSASECDFLLLPPCLGADPEAHRQLFDALEESLSIPVAEMPAARDSIHGWRLSRALKRGVTDFGRVLSARPERLVPAGERTSGRVSGVQCSDGTTLEADAVVLATGRWVDGGLPGAPPMVEPLTGAPIWLDGAPLSGFEEAYPPDFLDRRPWDDHRLFRSGVSIDADGRLRGRDGAPRSDNVYAVGRMLGGFNPAHDGCSMGVELVTARTVAERICQTLKSPAPAASRTS